MDCVIVVFLGNGTVKVCSTVQMTETNILKQVTKSSRYKAFKVPIILVCTLVTLTPSSMAPLNGDLPAGIAISWQW